VQLSITRSVVVLTAMGLMCDTHGSVHCVHRSVRSSRRHGTRASEPGEPGECYVCMPRARVVGKQAVLEHEQLARFRLERMVSPGVVVFDISVLLGRLRLLVKPGPEA